MSDLSAISVAILAGGLGTRLRLVVPGQQKVIAKVGEYPFLKYILNQLNKTGFKNIVICTGYLGNQIWKAFGDHYKNLSLKYSNEQSQLGTAGAIRLALPLLKSENILITNGDSFLDIDFEKFFEFHISNDSNGTIALTEVSDTSRSGKVDLNKNNQIINFEEKKENGGIGIINGGVYLIKRSLLMGIPENKNISFEKEVFTKWIGKGFYGFRSKGRFIDIGIPESYKEAQNFFTKKKRFVILDRDGTVILDKDHLTKISDVELIPNAGKAIKKFKELGLGVIIVTNQTVVGNGHISLEDLELIHKRILELLLAEGATVDGIYFCPHKVEDNCSCRKPKLGLIEQALKNHNFNPKECFVIGDNTGDIELGKNMGAISILVRTGYGKKVEKDGINANYVTDSLEEALPFIKNELSS